MKPINTERIREAAKTISFPDGRDVRTLGFPVSETLSKTFGTSLKSVEIAALHAKIMPERYIRNHSAFSMEDQVRLLESTVFITGVGGLGGTVAEILARSGIGTLRLVDMDRFEDNNLNRQLFSSKSTLASPKVEAAAKRLHDVNPAVEIITHVSRMDANNAENLMEGSDAAADCLDNIETRFILEKAARRLGLPVVSGAVAGFGGHVTTVFPGDDGLKRIYGDDTGGAGAESTLGCLPFAVWTVASCQSAEIIKILLQKNPLPSNRMLCIDFMSNTFDIFQL